MSETEAKHKWDLIPVVKGPIMTTIRNPDGTTVTSRTEIRCGLPSDMTLEHSRVEHVPGRRGGIMVLTMKDGTAIRVDVDHLQCGELLSQLGLSQRQAWENDAVPEDLLDGERISPPAWVGRVPDSAKVLQMRRRA